MQRCAAGDHAALGDLFDAITPPLSAHIARRVDAGRVDRIVRAVLLELHRARGSYVIGTEVLPWAIAIARKMIGDRPAVAANMAMPFVEGSTATLRLSVELARLAEPMRSAWELVCLDRLTPTQAAAVLGTSRAQVCARIQQAEATLAATLCELDGTLDEGLGKPEKETRDPLGGVLALGRYRIERRIGGGAHGDVYLAADMQLHRPVALKVLRSEHDDANARQLRFAREVDLLRRIDDPGLVPVFDVGRLDDGRHCYAMEYLQGHSLAQALAGHRRMSWPEVAAITRRICETLAVVHRRGIVHRDVKPGNCFLEHGALAAEHVRLLDFGVAKLTEDGGGEPLTSPGVLVGTAEYMAPEQLRGERVDARTDVYALGITMYEALVGRRPFVGETLVSIITQHLFSRPQRPSEVLGDPTLVEVDAVILRALAKEPGERYAEASELADAIARVSVRDGSSTLSAVA